MFKFLRKNKKEEMKPTGGDSTISSDQLLDGEEKETDTLVKTTLSIHPSTKVTSEEKYYFQFLNNELPQLKENQLSISGVDLKKDGSKLYITAFVRNSLSKGIKLSATPLLLLDTNGEKLGRKEFDLSVLGEIPARSSRPWQFIFDEKDLAVQEIPQTDWKLAFELKKPSVPHSLDLEDTWKKSMADGDKEKLESLVKTMDPPKKGEVNFLGIQAKVTEQGQLQTTLLIRNGSEKNITLQQLPLIVEDASGEVVAKGAFSLSDLEVKSNTSKPWTFLFPSDLLIKEEPDLSKWRAYPPQQ
jgi:accessory Sec system S-layer assembly protein